MPIWRVTINKMMVAAGRNWTNVYFVDVADGAAAQTAANSFVTAERSFHLVEVLFTSARVDDNTPDTDIYDTFAINAFGQRTHGSQIMPLWNTLRVDFNTAGSGRPSRKYYRGCLSEGDVDFLQLGAASVTEFQTGADAIAAVTSYVDVDGQDIINGEVYPFPQMRQLKRGSKKKITP